MNLSIDVKFGACQFWGVCLICCGVHPTFYHKFFIPDHPLHQFGIYLMIWNPEKNIITTKNEKKRLSGWCFMGFEPFSHGIHHIRVYMHHVCLIQSISARKATHIQLGTRSGSSQCQLHFGTKMVSIG
jgi:hypothetical protein